MLGDDLLDRPRHGRIYLQEKWIHFPLKPQDLLLHTTPGFAINAAADMAVRVFRKSRPDVGKWVIRLGAGSQPGENGISQLLFAVCMKIWGVPAEQLSGIQARKRVSANSPLKMARKTTRRGPWIQETWQRKVFLPQAGIWTDIESLRAIIQGEWRRDHPGGEGATHPGTRPITI